MYLLKNVTARRKWRKLIVEVAPKLAVKLRVETATQSSVLVLGQHESEKEILSASLDCLSRYREW